MTTLSENKMHIAIAHRDASYDNQFYYGVITAGVFCLPSCSTKKANPDNVRFFCNIESAMQLGFRPCKRCHPAGQGEASRHIGMTPKAYKAGGDGEIIYYACRETALGFMIMAATNKGVCSVQFDDNEDALLTLLSHEFPNAQLVPSAAQNATELDNWVLALDEHISQGAPKPDVPLDIKGTAFQIKVWQFLLSINEGDVMSYADVAKHIDKPKAIRAVGTACGKNLIGVLIPCHRVLRGDGSLGGYRWGLERKRMLLSMEKAVGLPKK